MWVTENARFIVKVERNLGLDFVKKTAQIIAKSSASLQLGVSDMLTSLLLPWWTFAVVDPGYGRLISASGRHMAALRLRRRPRPDFLI